VKIYPNFFIVGAARSGTTALHRYLSLHPQICMAAKKETHFFATGHFPPCTGAGDDRLRRTLIQDEEQYEQLFAGANGAKAIGESSVYYLYFRETAERIAQTVPEAKILILLREPVARAYSAYTFMLTDGREMLGFEESLGREQERIQKGWEPIWWYKELGLYSRQVRQYMDVFGTQQVKMLLYEEFFANLGQTLREVFGFLGVNEDVVIDTAVRANASGIPTACRLSNLLESVLFNPAALQGIVSLIPFYLRLAWVNRLLALSLDQVSMPAHLQLQLKTYFAEDVGRLEELLQRDLPCWRFREESAA
jgi:Sulfotransferase family